MPEEERQRVVADGCNNPRDPCLGIDPDATKSRVMGICIIVCLLMAAFCAEYDAGRILEGKPIHHRIWWMIRASVMVITCIAMGVPLMAVGCAGLFSAAFRLELNAARCLTWYYISDSNWYDAAWIKMAGSAKAGGILAYCAEGIVFLAVATWYLMR